MITHQDYPTDNPRNLVGAPESLVVSDDTVVFTLLRQFVARGNIHGRVMMVSPIYMYCMKHICSCGPRKCCVNKINYCFYVNVMPLSNQL